MLARKLGSLLLAVALIIVLALPVGAAESNVSDWIELLETATVDDSGTNLYTLNGQSGFFRIKTPQYMRCTKVDMLIAHASGYTPKAVKVRYNGGYYTLTMAKIDAYTTRVYGDNIPDTLYADLVFEIIQNGTGTAYYQILSCRVTSITATQLNATAYAEINGSTYNAPFFFSYDDPDGADMYNHYQFPIVVTDWQKFDKITISGSVGSMALNSVRCTIGGLGLPYEMSYAVSNSSGVDGNSYTWNEMKYYTYDESYKGTGETGIITSTEYLGKTLFTITIDLSSVDRTSKEHLWVFFTGLSNDWLGYSIQILQVTGQVNVADTSDMSLWQRFTSFMNGLFDSDTTESEDFQEDAGQQSDALDDMNSQMNSVVKPDVGGIQMDVGGYVDTGSSQNLAGALSGLTTNSLLVSMMCITLTIALVGYVLYGKR